MYEFIHTNTHSMDALVSHEATAQDLYMNGSEETKLLLLGHVIVTTLYM